MLSSHLRLGLQGGLFSPWGFRTKSLYELIPVPIHSTFTAHLILLIRPPKSNTKYEAPRYTIFSIPTLLPTPLWTETSSSEFCFRRPSAFVLHMNVRLRVSHSYKFIIINNKDWTLWSVNSPELQLLAPAFLRSSNCSPSLWSVVVWFQRDSLLWHSLQVLKPVPSVFIYLV